MIDAITILRPSLISFRNISKKPGKGGRTKFIFVMLFTFLLWLLIFLFSVKVLNNLKAGELLGELLCRKFMGLIWITASALLMFSSLITSLSSFYLAKDLGLVMAAPVSRESIFWARSMQSLLSAAWMPAAFMLPLLLAYGYVFSASWLYYLMAPLAAVPSMAIVSFVSQMLIMILVNLLPARRTRDIMSLLAIVAFCALYMAFRMMRPEDLVNPQSFMSTAAYLASLDAPSSAFLPTSWPVDLLWPLLSTSGDRQVDLIPLALLWINAAAFGVSGSYVAALLYWPGYNKSLEGAGRQKTVGGVLQLFTHVLTFYFKPVRRAVVVKDIKIFFRDHTQWSQLLLLAALLAVYIYNFSVLNLSRFPIDVFYLENAFAFLNLGLAALVAATLALRFAFPSISSEGFSYWIIKSAPLSLNSFMWIKYWLWTPPIWLIAMLLIAAGNSYLNIPSFMNVVSLIVTAMLTPALTVLAVGLGAIYPRFESENLAQVPTGYGGLIYMVSSSLFSITVIGLLVFPVIKSLQIVKGTSQWTGSGIVLSVALVLASCLIIIGLTIIPMKRGAYALTYNDEEVKKEKSDEKKQQYR